MTRYWAIAPAEYSPKGKIGTKFQKCWQYDLARGVISVGWDLGETPESREHLAWLGEEYADPEWANSRACFRMLEKFWFAIEPGDMVVARAGLTRHVGLGEFQGHAFYDQDAVGETWGCSFRSVLWEPFQGERNSPIRFTRPTLYALQPDQFSRFEL